MRIKNYLKMMTANVAEISLKKNARVKRNIRSGNNITDNGLNGRVYYFKKKH